jgi:hypothetical protein
MNSFLLVSIISIVSATCIVFIKACYASKCEKISFCWGFLNVSREVEYENTELQDSQSNQMRPQIFRQRKNVQNGELEVVNSVERNV